MEAAAVDGVVIVGAGIAGLTAALGLHRLGIRSLVLESSERLRTTGFAITMWPNAWKALDAVGVGDSLRREVPLFLGSKTYSAISGLETSDIRFNGKGDTQVGFEIRCVQRKSLLETLERQLPSGTIRYSAKVVSVEESGPLKLLHLADGSILRAKVLIGCDGVNSTVAKWLGFKKPALADRVAIRGNVYYDRPHGMEPVFKHYYGRGVRFGVIPYDDTSVHWFFGWSPSPQDKGIEDDPVKMKHFVLSRLGKVPDQVKQVFEMTELDNIIMSPLRFRFPWEVAWGNISTGNVCVAGDAFHSIPPDLGQGGCIALEDGVILARCLGQALKNNHDNKGGTVEEEMERIEAGLKNYAKERRWRAFQLITAAFMAGYIQRSNWKVVTFLRDRVASAFLAGKLMKIASFDCGKLSSS